MSPPVNPVAPNRTTSRSRVGIRSSCQGTRPDRQPSHRHERWSTNWTRRRRRHRTRCGLPDRHRGGQRDDHRGAADRRPDVPTRGTDRAGQRRPDGARQLRGAARLVCRARRRAGRAVRVGQPHVHGLRRGHAAGLGRGGFRRRGTRPRRWREGAGQQRDRYQRPGDRGRRARRGQDRRRAAGPHPRRRPRDPRRQRPRAGRGCRCRPAVQRRGAGAAAGRRHRGRDQHQRPTTWSMAAPPG